MSRFFFIIIVLISGVGCLKFKSKPPQQQVTTSTDQHAAADFRVKWNQEPNSYFVSLIPPSGTDYILKTQVDAAINDIQLLEFTNQNLFEDKNVSPGKTYLYRFAKGTGTQKEIIQEMQIKIPQDLVVKKTVNLDSNKNFFNGYNRIFFQTNSSVFISNNNLTIRANEIISDSGEIRTFPEGAKANPGEGGRSGGILTILTCKLTGNLKFQLSGESGGDGLDGEPYKNRAPDGQTGALVCTPDDRFNFQCDPLSSPTSGANGATGRRGGNGGRAGSSGTLVLKFVTDSNFTFNLINEPGNPGNPGARGPGQPGGRKGSWNGGNFSIPSKFVPALPENLVDGKTGDPGEPGLPGAQGQAQAPTIERTNFDWCQ